MRKCLGLIVIVFLAVVYLLPMPPAFADTQCDAEIANIDKEFHTLNPLGPDVLKEAKALRDQAYALCQAGDVTGGLNLLKQAKDLLSIN